jgi:hypothetical protein
MSNTTNKTERFEAVEKPYGGAIVDTEKNLVARFYSHEAAVFALALVNRGELDTAQLAWIEA